MKTLLGIELEAMHVNDDKEFVYVFPYPKTLCEANAEGTLQIWWRKFRVSQYLG